MFPARVGGEASTDIIAARAGDNKKGGRKRGREKQAGAGSGGARVRRVKNNYHQLFSTKWFAGVAGPVFSVGVG